MLDRLDACAQGGVDAFPATRVRRHRTTEATRLIDDRLELLVGPVRPAVERAVVADVCVAVSVDLDPVRAELHLLADGASQIVRAIDELRARRNFDFPRVPGQ